MNDSLADRLLDRMANDPRFAKQPPRWIAILGWLALIGACTAASIGYAWWTHETPPPAPSIRLETR